MSTWRSFFAVIAAASLGLCGCDGQAADEAGTDAGVTVEETTPETDVEVGPEGDVDVDVEPEGAATE